MSGNSPRAAATRGKSDRLGANGHRHGATGRLRHGRGLSPDMARQDTARVCPPTRSTGRQAGFAASRVTRAGVVTNGSLPSMVLTSRPSDAEPERMAGHRTTARGILFLLLLAVAAAASASAFAHEPVEPPPPGKQPKTGDAIVFPVVGKSLYTDDFSDPRGQGRHQGNDIIAPRRALVVAAEDGTVKLHTTSWRAGCMLYLYGTSGTTYLYVHLNNDLGNGNDNKGKCVAGVAYAPHLKSGAKVKAGELIAFLGDSGDADGINPHLHFEVHPKDGGAVSPYPYLQKATRLLFAAKPGSMFTLAVTGTMAAFVDGRIDLKVDRVRNWPNGRKVTHDGQLVSIDLPETAELDRTAIQLRKGAAAPRVTVYTTPAKVTLAALAGEAGALTAARLVAR
jgi:Peptidase family M23